MSTQRTPVDLKMVWDLDAFEGDLVMGAAGDLETGEQLKTAAIVSLLTWRLAGPDDDLLDTGGDRMGWWGDTYAEVENDLIGSRLWQLARRSLTQKTVNDARTMCEEATAWFVEDGVASRVEVDLERRGINSIVGTITIYRTAGTPLVLRFDDLWEAIRA